MPVTVYSTLSAPVVFATYRDNPNEQLRVIKDSIQINGHAGVAISGRYAQPQTLIGYATQIPDESYSWLKDHSIFKDMVEKGFLTPVEERLQPPEKLTEKAQKHAKNMPKDASAPITPLDYESGGRIESVIGKEISSKIPKVT